MLMFQRRTVIGRSIVLSRISFNKPVPTRLVAENADETVALVNRKQPKLPNSPF